MVRAQTVNDHPRFLDMMTDVVLRMCNQYGHARPLELVPATRTFQRCRSDAMALAIQTAMGPALSAQGSRAADRCVRSQGRSSTLTERPTGCTVVLAEKGATAGVDVRGSAPGTRETDLLAPTASSSRCAIMLGGGSAFGLDAASGVMRYLEERCGLQVWRFSRANRAGRDPVRPSGRRRTNSSWRRLWLSGGAGSLRRPGSRGECRRRRWCHRGQDGRT